MQHVVRQKGLQIAPRKSSRVFLVYKLYCRLDDMSFDMTVVKGVTNVTLDESNFMFLDINQHPMHNKQNF